MHRGVPWIAAGAGIALVLPSLWSGLHQDDYIVLAVLSGQPPLSEVYPSRLDVFNFFSGPGERMNRMIDLGLLPWWTDRAINLSFWRPLAALTHWIDSVLWRGSPAAMHAHSLSWFAALIVTVTWLYRRLLPAAWAAGLGGLLYAVDPGHTMSITWIAARSHLVGTLLGAAALFLHDRWRRDGWRPGAIAAPALFASALLASEAAVAFGGYVLAHVLVLDPADRAKRWRALMPYVAIVVAWQLVYQSLGYGARSDATPGPVGYANPVHEPLTFLRRLITNGPIMLLSQWGGPTGDGYAVPAPWVDRRWLLSVLVLLVIAAILTPLLRVDRLARFWALGQVLALFPTGAVSPLDHYLFPVGLGVMGLAACYVAWAFGAWAPRSRFRWSLAMVPALAFLYIHLVVAPWQLHRAAKWMAGFGAHDVVLAQSMPGDPDVRRQTLVIPYVPSSLSVAYSFYIRAVEGQPIAAHVRLLAAGDPVEVSRPDAHTLVVRGLGRAEHNFRPPERPLRVGDEIALTGVRVEIRAVGGDGRPTETAFRFDQPLEDSSLRWIRWTAAGYEPWTPPPLGGRVRLD